MFIYNSCPKCKWKLLVERDIYGWYEECIMCGYMRDLEELVADTQSNVKDTRKAPVEVSNWVGTVNTIDLLNNRC
jgi:hypothetical protein